MYVRPQNHTHIHILLRVGIGLTMCISFTSEHICTLQRHHKLLLVLSKLRTHLLKAMALEQSKLLHHNRMSAPLLQWLEVCTYSIVQYSRAVWYRLVQFTAKQYRVQCILQLSAVQHNMCSSRNVKCYTYLHNYGTGYLPPSHICGLKGFY